MGIQVVESKVDEMTHFTNMLIVRVASDGIKREVRGTTFPASDPRLIGIDEFDVDVPLEGDFVMTKHDDMPGMIGKVGMMLGNRHINIANMNVGRETKGGRAIMLMSVDHAVGKEVLDELRAEKNFHEARSITLSHMKTREYMSL
jgi:D-3-phosphoglycerate dehydrogenase